MVTFINAEFALKVLRKEKHRAWGFEKVVSPEWL
jgi:hypothetical protein